MPKRCDNKSVGVIIERDEELLLLKRAKYPFGYAPPAGHVDDHGSYEQAAVDEVGEELGLAVSVAGLIKTSIWDRRTDLACRREGGDHHIWRVYRATEFDGVLSPDADETAGADWQSVDSLQALADKTRIYLDGLTTEEDWRQDPGIEVVWLGFLVELGYIS